MKTSNDSDSVRPRLWCRVVQGWAAMLGDGAAPQAGAFGARHVASCACCRRFFSRSDELELSLRRAAEGQRESVRPGLDERIMGAVGRSAQAAAPRRRFSGGRSGAFALVGAAASVALAILVLQKTRGPEGVREKLAAGDAWSRDAAGDSSEERVLARWQPEAAALLGGEPLQREVEAVYSDARSALGFLALNFLPGRADDPPPRRPASG